MDGFKEEQIFSPQLSNGSSSIELALRRPFFTNIQLTARRAQLVRLKHSCLWEGDGMGQTEPVSHLEGCYVELIQKGGKGELSGWVC